jgi:ABC-type transporter Mla subunit MlaD
VSTPGRHDPDFARRTTAFLAAQRDIYRRLLDALDSASPSDAPADAERLATLIAAVSDHLRPLADQTPTLAALMRRLGTASRDPGPGLEAVGRLAEEVGALAAEARRRLESVVGDLRAEQTRTMAEIQELDRAMPAGYLPGGPFPALLYDRTG